MKKLLFGLIVVTLALAIMAPGTPPVKKTPPPVETTEPPPVETQPVETEPVETEPVETEPVITEEPTEPPVVATDVGDWPGYIATQPERERKDMALPKSGYGPQDPDLDATMFGAVCGAGLLAMIAALAVFAVFGKQNSGEQ